MITVTPKPLFPKISNSIPTKNALLLTAMGAPTPQTKQKNLQLVLAIDRSGSMSGDGIQAAKDAACQLVDTLSPTDMIGIIAFGSHVEEIAPLDLVEDRNDLKKRIQAIRIEGSTALFGGWTASLELLRKSKETGGIKRIILLSDGQANIGMVDTDSISNEVKQASAQGISTSTLGLGRYYNEELLEAMALSGEGNYFYIEQAAQIKSFLTTELSGAKAVVLRNAELEIMGDGVQILSCFAPFQLVSNKISIGSLTQGFEKEILVEFVTEPSGQAIITVKLTGRTEDNTPFESHYELVLAGVDTEWVAVSEDPQVKERVEVAKAALERQKAEQAIRDGNREQAQVFLENATQILYSAPASEYVQGEIGLLNKMKSYTEAGELELTSKLSRSMTYARSSTLVRESMLKAYTQDQEDKLP